MKFEQKVLFKKMRTDRYATSVLLQRSINEIFKWIRSENKFSSSYFPTRYIAYQTSKRKMYSSKSFTNSFRVVSLLFFFIFILFQSLYNSSLSQICHICWNWEWSMEPIIWSTGVIVLIPLATNIPQWMK